VRQRKLGPSGLMVSEIVCGTMTWGEQNTEAEAHAQLDLAYDMGLNTYDAAELYPVPSRRETQGRTEAYIGTWLARRKVRDKIILATKVVGRQGAAKDYFRDWPGGTRLDRRNIEYALDQSLRHLRTDYVDLYQIHWPDRTTTTFGRTEYVPVPDEDSIPLEETLGVLGDLVKAGKIRHVGLSNETAWGTMRYLEIARRTGLPLITSLQNAYSLLNRTFERTLAEVSHFEDIPLLAYSPLAMGLLTGKYIDGAKPARARLTLFPYFERYNAPEGHSAAASYVAIAQRHGLDPAQMALAYILTKPFVAGVIVGATSTAQLRTDIEAANLTLSAEVLSEIETVHRAFPNPCP
jgi:aryl-alcohol dehydrogenase-like predicted oxidoreductase